MRDRTQTIDSTMQPVGAPRTGNGAVRRRPPARATNASVRSREHLVQNEVERLIEAARAGRNGVRDAIMILVAYRHALRVSELVTVRWSDIDFDSGALNVKR